MLLSSSIPSYSVAGNRNRYANDFHSNLSIQKLHFSNVFEHSCQRIPEEDEIK